MPAANRSEIWDSAAPPPVESGETKRSEMPRKALCVDEKPELLAPIASRSTGSSRSISDGASVVP